MLDAMSVIQLPYFPSERALIPAPCLVRISHPTEGRRLSAMNSWFDCLLLNCIRLYIYFGGTVSLLRVAVENIFG